MYPGDCADWLRRHGPYAEGITFAHVLVPYAWVWVGERRKETPIAAGEDLTQLSLVIHRVWAHGCISLSDRDSRAFSRTCRYNSTFCLFPLSRMIKKEEENSKFFLPFRKLSLHLNGPCRRHVRRYKLSSKKKLDAETGCC